MNRSSHSEVAVWSIKTTMMLSPFISSAESCPIWLNIRQSRQVVQCPAVYRDFDVSGSKRRVGLEVWPIGATDQSDVEDIGGVLLGSYVRCHAFSPLRTGRSLCP